MLNDDEFRGLVKQILTEARTSAQNVVLHEQQPDKDVKDIKQLLEYGDEFGDAFGDTSWNDFTKVMGSPGKVKDAIAGSIAKVGAKARSLLSVIVRGVPSLVIPFVRTYYDQIYSREAAQMSKIRQKYPDVFKNAGQLFTDDAKMVAFMINPVLMLSAVATDATLDAALGLAAALGAGDQAITDQIKRIWRNVNRMPGQVQKVKKVVQGKPTNDDDDISFEAFLREDQTPQRSASRIFKDSRFQQRLSKSPIVQTLKKNAETMKNATLNAVIKLAQDISQIQDLEGIKDLDAGLAQKIEQQISRLEPDETEAILKPIIDQVKQASIQALVERLNVSIEELQQLRVPPASEMIRAYQKAIEQIEAQG